MAAHRGTCTEESRTFASLNRGKKASRSDMTRPEAQEAIHRLVRMPTSCSSTTARAWQNSCASITPP